jgi:hypothetical protein
MLATTGVVLLLQRLSTKVFLVPTMSIGTLTPPLDLLEFLNSTLRYVAFVVARRLYSIYSYEP